jgi:HAD superfamily hydrolase (TIGR01450 family)
LTARFDAIRAFLLDMDGTIYLGDHLLPGAREFWTLAAQRGIPIQLLTNNSSKNRASYVRKLAAMGLEVFPAQILTSGEAAAQYLKLRDPGARVALFGTVDLECEFIESGFILDVENPQHVVLGFDTTIDYGKLTRLCNLVGSGLPYIATHPDFNCPVEGGYIPDIGAIMAFVLASTGREADVVIGKPNHHMIDIVGKRLELPVETLCMVGDRLYTDVAMGQHAPIQTALVLSGETKREDLVHSAYQPDYVFQGLDELTKYLTTHCAY